MTTVVVRQRASQRFLLMLGGILGLALVLRLVQIGAKPGYDWDEPVYTNIAGNLAEHGKLLLKTQYGETDTTWLYHPPFYFVALAGWFKLFGVGITQARVFAALGSIIGIGGLSLVVRRVANDKAALFTAAVLGFDGWMIFTNRVSWIENSMLALIALALWGYTRAVRLGTTQAFVVAGLLLGAVTIYKHTGAYLIVAVLINMLINRTRIREHIALLIATAVTVVTYIGAMLLIFWRHGHNQYASDSLVQIKRTLGLQSHRGTINTPADYIVPLFSQYSIFLGTVVFTIVAVILVVVRAIQCGRSRSFDAVRDNSILFSWAVSAILSFGAIDLKFPHYFELIFIPLALYLITEAQRVAQEAGRLADASSETVVRVLKIGFAITIALGLMAFALRIENRHDNALKETRAYAAANLPANAVVLTEETIGAIIPQQYCNFNRAQGCTKVATYMITYTSYTQHLSPNTAFQAELKHSTVIHTIKGFKETIEFWRINPTS